MKQLTRRFLLFFGLAVIAFAITACKTTSESERPTSRRRRDIKFRSGLFKSRSGRFDCCCLGGKGNSSAVPLGLDSFVCKPSVKTLGCYGECQVSLWF